ncbi:hypothetical protein A3H80_00045 [Candidatus Roizmanbacteria bacterium RIFCSPLOWO2_02_FULL_37_19]|uniref:Uncharacterized protein n=1 Tax=Candidatus Roizmanbacteria bacterium RIFCSPHIGHO2_02_FULL_37_24 TaxID=1802037 RepID=A0A1F7H1E3_9BACT|nr:MAG: hypothetical protein A2862_00725 [Candidatus Roizmanbacteria bacterium RIFCSPHIGHO2_01_FULL_38_41]OGK24754.1 MAG: hypothetical protein A3C24_01300 [Candidatus Roizmanbacteria bacterium RIFCSPHIGHO2_02_FULL_37_24]OGK31898.1 MAG: hypothetical protein A3E10_05635 [Candidatus Roizmanbacteria bacterium RIFCSPHIGHO2_12_FULL_37_23]OGK45054.1 MAG: hypothetical protein A2956_04490 [Candidatus Roizmanbacteria bacterium RIFCSPLOWO2_01_FULL_37_57]OGK53919.1 MAG: hypothetical protein A3H80_00045 [Ca
MNIVQSVKIYQFSTIKDLIEGNYSKLISPQEIGSFIGKDLRKISVGDELLSFLGTFAGIPNEIHNLDIGYAKIIDGSTGFFKEKLVDTKNFKPKEIAFAQIGIGYKNVRPDIQTIIPEGINTHTRLDDFVSNVVRKYLKDKKVQKTFNNLAVVRIENGKIYSDFRVPLNKFHLSIEETMETQLEGNLKQFDSMSGFFDMHKSTIHLHATSNDCVAHVLTKGDSKNNLVPQVRFKNSSLKVYFCETPTLSITL